MEKVSKAVVIARAFTTESKIDSKILQERREICKGCDFNSLNTDYKDMGLIEKARKKLLENEPFCTACGCQINEKTSQETEECGLGEKGLTPKWNRITVETTGRLDLNLINKSQDKVNIDLDKSKKYFEINFGTIEKNSIAEIEFLLESRVGKVFTIDKFRPSCGACTTANYKKVDESNYKCNVSLNTRNLMTGTFKKTIYISYKLGNVQKNSEVKLVGTVK